MNATQLLCLLGAILASTVGCAVLLRQQRTTPVWAFGLGMMELAAEVSFSGLAIGSIQEDRALVWGHLALFTQTLLPITWLVFSLSYSRGNYEDFFRLYQWWFGAAAMLPVAMLFLWPVTNLVGPTEDPSKGWHFQYGLAAKILKIAFLGSCVVILMNLESTFRSAVGTMRWRIKLVIVALGLIFGARIYTSSQSISFSGHHPTLVAVQAASLAVGCMLISGSFLRGGLASVDVYPSRAFLQQSITLLLAGAYLAIVGGASRIVGRLGGEAAFPLKAFLVLLALAGVPLLLLSDRIRERAHRFVSRHFRRPVYDYRKVWTDCLRRIGPVAKEDELCRSAVQIISETLSALSVTIWLIDDERGQLRFGASTTLTPEMANRLLQGLGEPTQVIQSLRTLAQPTDLDSATSEWKSAMKAFETDQFRRVGNRLCAPVKVGGKVIGFILLMNRVSGVPFSEEDTDLVQSLAEQVGVNLANLSLSQQLLQAREFEAFQAMSAFFVHDLKNTVSTLTLMLKNLPVHFQNPEFRADALKAIGAAVDRLNELTSRLGQVRQGLAENLGVGSLNDVIRREVETVGRNFSGELITRFGQVPPVPMDSGQMTKVFTNLLLNAREAMGQGGRIVVETGADADFAWATVEDNGVGMTPEFIRNSLFRPFQTTKRQGLGIGMFQSKMIVEAHQGRLTVESSPGTGSTFKVRLPLRRLAKDKLPPSSPQ